MEAEILPLIDFSKVKKKKKEVIKPKEEPKKVEKEPEKKEEGEDLSNVLLEKKKSIKPEVPAGEQSEVIKEEYTYDELLERVYNLIKNHNPELSSERANLKIPAPQINSVGKLRSAWMNFNAFVEGLNRPQEHLLNFVKGELGAEMNVAGTEGDQLFIKAKVTKNQIEQILRKYIQEYVKCPNCKSFKTIIKRDQATRLQQLFCESCKTEKTIQSVKQQSVKAGKR